MKDKDYLYIFHHIPKNGGSSFKKQIIKNFKEENIFRFYYYDSMLEEGKLDRKVLMKRFKDDLKTFSPEKKRKIKLLYGEGVPYGIHKYFDRPARYITFLRNPYKRVLSWYNYLVGTYKRDIIKGVANMQYNDKLLIDGEIPTFNDWVVKKYGEEKTTVRTMSQHLKHWGYLEGGSKKDINKMLDKFYFIATTKNLRDDLRYLSYVFGFNKFFIRENISKKIVKKVKDERIKEVLAKKNRLDEKIYEEGLKKRERFIKKEGDYYKKVNLVKLKRFFLLPITQILFDPKGLLIETSAYLRRKSKSYEKYFDILRGHRDWN